MPKQDLFNKINSMIEASDSNTLNFSAFHEMLPSDMDEGEVDEIMEYLTAQGVELVGRSQQRPLALGPNPVGDWLRDGRDLVVTKPGGEGVLDVLDPLEFRTAVRRRAQSEQFVVAV